MDEFQIENSNNKFTFYLKNPNKSILLSLIKTGILLGGTITDNFQTITFKAHSVETLSFFIEKKEINYYDLSLNIFYFITKQLEYLINKEKKCFYAFKPENFLVIDNNKIIYLSNDLLEIKDNYLTIWKPFPPKQYYISPELSKIFTLPSKIHYKTIYYSLALLIINFYYDTSIINLNRNNIDKIKGTKLYYALNRCLEDNPENRTILFI